MIPAGMAQRFRDREIGIVQFDIFADQANRHFRARPLDAAQPVRAIRASAVRCLASPVPAPDIRPSPASSRMQRHFIDRIGSQHAE